MGHSMRAKIIIIIIIILLCEENLITLQQHIDKSYRNHLTILAISTHTPNARTGQPDVLKISVIILCVCLPGFVVSSIFTVINANAQVTKFRFGKNPCRAVYLFRLLWMVYCLVTFKSQIVPRRLLFSVSLFGWFEPKRERASRQ